MKVHHITPARADKNIGEAMNDLVMGLPDEDWVAFRDIDTLPLNHREFIKQCEEIAASGDFGLVGAVTNRIGLKYQLHDEEISENWDIKHHIDIANERVQVFGCEVREMQTFLIAGFFMLFPVSIYNEVGGFPVGKLRMNGAFFDYTFSKAVQDAGHKIGIADGIYIFHLYREWAENVRLQYQHLI